jgi:hypothetical protein
MTCEQALGPREVIVRILAATEQTRRGSLGDSTIDLAARSGCFSTVYADRITNLAAATGADIGTLLGRAIAHEIGHLLLGTVVHAEAGLMRAHWSGEELRREQPSDWVFSQIEARQMKRQLAARARRERGVQGVIASAQP